MNIVCRPINSPRFINIVFILKNNKKKKKKNALFLFFSIGLLHQLRFKESISLVKSLKNIKGVKSLVIRPINSVQTIF